jgi:hypothetical protein
MGLFDIVRALLDRTTMLCLLEPLYGFRVNCPLSVN